jgi:2-keto-4-pentenoate hydratase/2-oxohepta-3-ene-1,7-dioic acid hydratase in catechol pathway
MGPFLVAAPDTGVFPPRMLLGGRSYADEAKRGWPVPDGHRPQTLYLRQLTLVSEDHQTPDPMLWSIPQIIRAILAPDSAVRFSDAPVTLQPGDVICLGTPGGTVITAKPPLLVDVADTLLFWWEALDWHDAFFAGSEALYLNPGDAVFFWAEGLGFQYLPVEHLPD